MAQKQFIIDGGFTTNADSSLVGNLSMTGHIIPTVDSNGTTGYDLGTPDMKWRDLYLSQGSLYIDGQKVLESNSGTIVVQADSDQSMTVKTAGTGVLTLQSDTTVNFAANLQIASGKAISSNDGNVTFSDKVDLDNNQIINVGLPTADGHATTKGYVDQLINNISTDAITEGDSEIEIADLGTGTVGITVDGSQRLALSGTTAAFTVPVTVNGVELADTADVATAVSTASTDATTKADAAVATASSDATAKADAALVSAKAYTDVEEAARIAADTALQTSIDNILSNTDASALDSLSEVVTAFEAADTNLNSAITTLASAASAGRDTNATAIVDETTRATAAELVLQDQITVLASDIGEEVTDREFDIATVRTELTDGDADTLVSAKAYTDAAEAAMSTLVSTSIAPVQTAVTGNDADIASLQTAVASNGTDIAANDADITSLQTAVAANEADITSLQTAVAGNDADITAVNAAVSSNDADIAALESAVSGNTSDIAALNSAVAGNDSDIAAINAAITGNDSDIATNASNIATINVAIASNDSDIAGLTGDLNSAVSTLNSALASNASASTGYTDTKLVEAKAYADTGIANAALTFTHFHSAVADITDSADLTYTFSDLIGAKHYQVYLNRQLIRPSELASVNLSTGVVTFTSGIIATGDEVEVTGFKAA